MARSRRYSKLHYCHHVICRGHHQKDIFRSDADRIRMLEYLEWITEKHQCYVHGFCLMSNHIHLILEPTKSSLSDSVHDLGFRYAQYFNRRYDVHGYLFQGRFKSFVVEGGQYLKTVIRYVHLNPFAAKIVSRPSEYKWSSHRSYLGLESYHWLKTERILRVFDAEPLYVVQSYQNFIRKVTEAEKEEKFIDLCSEYGVMGSESFIEEIIGIEARKEMSFRLAIEVLSLEEIISLTCKYFSISLDELVSSSRKKELLHARSALAWIGRQSSHLTLEMIGRRISRNASTLSRLANQTSLSEEVQKFLQQLKSMEAAQ